MNNIQTYELFGSVWRSVDYDISKSADIAKYLARHPYAWPGGYPLFAITDDGACLCPYCCRTEFRNIATSYPGDGWHVTAIDTNWEDPDLYCDHCSENIKPAYEPDNHGSDYILAE